MHLEQALKSAPIDWINWDLCRNMHDAFKTMREKVTKADLLVMTSVVWHILFNNLPKSLIICHKQFSNESIL